MFLLGKLKAGDKHWNYGISFATDIIRTEEYIISIFCFKFKKENWCNEFSKGFSLSLRFKKLI